MTPAKTEAIRAEFVRQCDKLDGAADGIINNYMACRAIFDMSQGAPGRNPWAAKRCPDNTDPNPQDTSAAACFTDGQISTLKLVYSHYKFATPLSNGLKSFGMWVPASRSFRKWPHPQRPIQGTGGCRTHCAVPFASGHSRRHRSPDEKSQCQSSRLRRGRSVEFAAGRTLRVAGLTNPDLSAFAKRGGKMIVAIGTNDTLASPGAQLDYYQSVLDKMGRAAVDDFARLYVIPQTGHGPHRFELHHGRRRPRNPGEADSKPLRPRRDAAGLGRTGRRAAEVRDGNG